MSKRKASDPARYRELSRKIIREWAAHLTSVEIHALLFILDRTLGWNKEEERISERHGTKGLVRDGVIYATPFAPNSKSLYARTMRRLCAMGCVSSRPCSNNGVIYKINEDWSPDPMKVPKRLRDLKQPPLDEGDRSPCEGGLSPPCEGEQRDTKEEIQIEQTAGPSDAAEIRKEMETIRVRSRKRRKAKRKEGVSLREDGSGFQPYKKNFIDVWVSLLEEFHPSAPLSLDYTSAKILWSYCEVWTKARNSGEFLDYLSWIFEKWNTLRSVAFHWMGDSCPAYPTTRVVCAHYHRMTLEEWWSKQETLESLSKMDPKERKQHYLVHNRGLDPEEAARRVDESSELAKARKIVEEERAKLRAEIARLERMRVVKVGKKKGPLVVSPDWNDED